MRQLLCGVAAALAGCTNSVTAADEPIVVELGETIEHEITAEQASFSESYVVDQLVISDDEARYQVTLPSGEVRWLAYARTGTESSISVLDAAGNMRVRTLAGGDGPTEFCVGGQGCQSAVDGLDAAALREELSLLELDLRNSPVVGLAALGFEQDVAYEWWEVGGWYTTWQSNGYWGGYWTNRGTWYWWGQPTFYCISYWRFDEATATYVMDGIDNCQSVWT